MSSSIYGANCHRLESPIVSHIFLRALFFVVRFSWAAHLMLPFPCSNTISPPSHKHTSHLPTHTHTHTRVFFLSNTQFQLKIPHSIASKEREKKIRQRNGHIFLCTPYLPLFSKTHIFFNLLKQLTTHT